MTAPSLHPSVYVTTLFGLGSRGGRGQPSLLMDDH
jgi:hypothetical protein